MYDIKWGVPSIVSQAQAPLMHKDVAKWLGGVTYLEHIASLAYTAKHGKTGFWYALYKGEVVGALLCGGRPSAFRAKYGSVGVLPEYRRQRIGSALYAAMTIQTLFEGKRLWEDSIVGDNPYQFKVLPTLGVKRVGELRHRTGSGKGLVLFDFSLIEEGALETMLSRVRGRDISIHILENWYTDEVWNANASAYEKNFPKFLIQIEQFRAELRSEPFIAVERDNALHPTLARQQKKQQGFLGVVD